MEARGEFTAQRKRRILIDIARRHQQPGTGSAVRFLRERTAMKDWPDLRPILEGIPWVVVGAVATRAYMPERATRDIDILAHIGDSDKLITRLQDTGYEKISRLSIIGWLMRAPNGTKVYAILGDYPWLDEALASPRADMAGYPVLDLPYLVLMKLKSGRVQDTADITRMLGLANEEELERVRAVVARYAAEDAEDVESLIILGKLELGDEKFATNYTN